MTKESCGAELAVELYRGDLLEGLAHDCFAAERERLADRYEDALVDVARARLRAGDARGARRAAERSWRETRCAKRRMPSSCPSWA